MSWNLAIHILSRTNCRFWYTHLNSPPLTISHLASLPQLRCLLFGICRLAATRGLEARLLSFRILQLQTQRGGHAPGEHGVSVIFVGRESMAFRWPFCIFVVFSSWKSRNCLQFAGHWQLIMDMPSPWCLLTMISCFISCSNIHSSHLNSEESCKSCGEVDSHRFPTPIGQALLFSFML